MGLFKYLLIFLEVPNVGLWEQGLDHHISGYPSRENYQFPDSDEYLSHDMTATNYSSKDIIELESTYGAHK